MTEFALRISSYEDEEWWYPKYTNYITSQPVNQNLIFGWCLESYLASMEGSCSLPKENSPWEFVKGETKEDIEQCRYEVIASLHTESKEALWEFCKWIRGCQCVALRVAVCY